METGHIVGFGFRIEKQFTAFSLCAKRVTSALGASSSWALTPSQQFINMLGWQLDERQCALAKIIDIEPEPRLMS
jgi:hypothetical protein